MEEMNPAQMSALRAAEAIREGELTSEELVEACLARIEEQEEQIGAWEHLDKEFALTQAREADLARGEGKALGPFHGVPVGIKDIIDTAALPTENGSPLHAGRRPTEDAAVVSLLKSAGAVIMGKTVTTEFAVYAPGKTKNPHDPNRTPGGSSSGSAAPVASCMVPVAVGSQTNGSVIRPASYCGVCGFKPTFGSISRYGMLPQSRPIDHVGLFGRSVEDLAFLGDQLMVFDARDPDMRHRAAPRLREIAASEPPVTPRFAFVKTPVWDQADEDAQAAFEELAAHLGEEIVEEVELPEPFNNAIEWHQIILESNLARNFEMEYVRGKDKISDLLCKMIERGQKYLAVDYTRAVERVPVLNGLLGEMFERFDALLTPPAPGQAPLGLGATGNPIFCTIWTLCGTPAVTLPLMKGADGMPLGVQLVGPKGDDARLLRTAKWLEARLGE